MGRIVGFKVGKCSFETKLSAEVTTTQLALMQPRTQQGEIILHFEWGSKDASMKRLVQIGFGKRVAGATKVS